MKCAKKLLNHNFQGWRQCYDQEPSIIVRCTNVFLFLYQLFLSKVKDNLFSKFIQYLLPSLPLEVTLKIGSGFHLYSINLFFSQNLHYNFHYNKCSKLLVIMSFNEICYFSFLNSKILKKVQVFMCKFCFSRKIGVKVRLILSLITHLAQVYVVKFMKDSPVTVET